MAQDHYDLVVIGSGPAGQKGAVAAAKLGKRVALIERKGQIGGVCLHTGTIPSKTLREGILYLTGYRQREFYGPDYTVKEKITLPDLRFRVQKVLERELGVITDQLRRNDIQLLAGTARFLDAHTLEVKGDEGTSQLTAEYVLVACGTRPASCPDIPFDGKRIFLSDQFGQLEKIPRDLIVVGGGVIGLEFASMLTALNINITLIDQRPTILDFVDQELIEALCYHLRRLGTTLRLGEKVTAVSIDANGHVRVELESGKRIQAEALLHAVGRQTNADTLNMEAAGLAADPRGRIQVNEYFQTAVPHIYAAGDVIGFPALASTSMEQGRLASHHMFGHASKTIHNTLPYGIYTIPEISMVGKTELELTKAKIPYEVGIAKYEEVAKGQMVGDHTGLLKILFHPDTLSVLGVHVIGENAAEIIHIGQAVIAMGGTMEYFRDNVFNYPTFAEAYKVAALNGLNKISQA